VLRAAAALSLGESATGVLALLSACGVNCLVLDEVANCVDVEAIEALERPLAGSTTVRPSS
jgi:ATPase subunit of ABC transporter with duplicated ATPase domains